MTNDPFETTNDAPVDRPLPAYYRATKNGGAVTVLTAAMLAVGEIFEPEKASVELVQPADDSGGDDYNLDFGHLPPLD